MGQNSRTQPHPTPAQRQAQRQDRERREQTKFDKWLEVVSARGEIIGLVLEYSPYSEDEFDIALVKVVEVDRYMIRIEFQEKIDDDDTGRWWIPKDGIKGVSDPVKGITAQDDRFAPLRSP